MPSTWRLRPRPKSPADEEDLELLQERYAARLDELLRVPMIDGGASDEVAGLWPDDDVDASPIGVPRAGVDDDALGLDDPLEVRPSTQRVPVMARTKPPIVVVAGSRPVATADVDHDPTSEPRQADASSPAGQAAVARPAVRSSGRGPKRSRTLRKPAGGRGRATASPPAASCPYCAVLLQPPPTTTRRCPRCRQRVVVKRAGERTVYLTEAAVPVFESERRRTIDHGRYVRARDRWLRLATAAGAPEDRVRRLADQLASDASTLNARALYMTTVDRAFREARRERRWETAARIRREQAAVLHRIAGRPLPLSNDVVALYRQGVSAQLRGISELARQAELVGPTCCDACAADQGRVFRVADELREPRLPHAGCPNGLCSCRWTLAAKDVADLRRLMRMRSRPASTGHTEPTPAP